MKTVQILGAPYSGVKLLYNLLVRTGFNANKELLQEYQEINSKILKGTRSEDFSDKSYKRTRVEAFLVLGKCEQVTLLCDTKTGIIPKFWQYMYKPDKFIIMARIPSDVVNALAARDHVDYRYGASLWYRYYSQLLDIPIADRIIVRFEDFFWQDYKQTGAIQLRRILQFLDLQEDIPVSDDRLENVVYSIVNPVCREVFSHPDELEEYVEPALLDKIFALQYELLEQSERHIF